MERKTKHFIEKNRKFIEHGKFNVEDYYGLSHLIRKELLSDVLQYESLVANMLIDKIGVFSLRPKDIEIFNDNVDAIIKDVAAKGSKGKLSSWDYYDLNYKYAMEPGSLELILHELNPGHIDDLVYQFNSPPRKDKHTKIEFHFEFMTLGSKIHVIQSIKEEIVIEALSEFLDGYEMYFMETKDKIHPLDDFLYPVLEFMRDIRNILAHRDIGLQFNDVFENAYKHNTHYIAEHKYKFDFMIKLFRAQLLIINNEPFYDRLKDKIHNDKRMDDEIFDEVFKDTNWKKI